MFIFDLNTQEGQLNLSDRYVVEKEYVASIIGLYKNNGAVSCVGINLVIF